MAARPDRLAPAFCDSCDTVWFTTGIAFGPDAVITLRGAPTASPCPNCGGSGRIPTGVYHPSITVLENTEFNRPVVAMLERLVAAAKSGASPAEIREQAAQSPILQTLVRYLPHDAKDLLAWLMILVAVFQGAAKLGVKPAQQQQPPVELMLPDDLSQAIHQLVISNRSESHSRTHTTTPQESSYSPRTVGETAEPPE